MTDTAKEKIILALDVSSQTEALQLVEELHDLVGYFKIGMQLYYSCGNALVREIIARGGRVFLDLKLHDIPNTVYHAARELSSLGVAMTNFHASGGGAMLLAAVQGLADGSSARPLALGVTVLTSLSDAALQQELGIPLAAEELVVQWAKLCQQQGCDGVVCSPREIQAVKQACGPEFITVTPGIRPVWAAKNDQHRIMTPAQAIKAGTDYMVIGRPIRAADNPRAAAERILKEVEIALNEVKSSGC